MAQLLTIGGVDYTAKIRAGSLVVRYNTLDVELHNLSGGGLPFARGDALHLKQPPWDGTLTVIKVADNANRIGVPSSTTVTAANKLPLAFNWAPFGLSDSPSVSAPVYLDLEDGSGTLELEDGNAWGAGSLELENVGDVYGYDRLAYTEMRDLQGVDTDLAEVTLYQPGLWPGMVTSITSTNLGGAGGLRSQTFYVTQVTVDFPSGNTDRPRYRLQLSHTSGQAMPTLDYYLQTHYRGV